MSASTRSRVLAAALFLGVFGAGTALGYVYRHDPQPEQVSVRVAAPVAPAGPRVLSGTVTAVESGKLTLATESGTVTLSLPSSAPVEQLARTPAGLAAGTPVNVGVEATQYGLTLTGIVAVEGAAR